jgi:hypothetical protein
MTIRGKWVGQAFINALAKESISLAIGYEIVSEVKNGGVHYLGKRTLRKSITAELGVWIDGADHPEGKKKLSYVMVKLSNYANGVIVHWYQTGETIFWEVAKKKANARVMALLEEFGEKIEGRQPGEERKTLEGVFENG